MRRLTQSWFVQCAVALLLLAGANGMAGEAGERPRDRGDARRDEAGQQAGDRRGARPPRGAWGGRNMMPQRGWMGPQEDENTPEGRERRVLALQREQNEQALRTIRDEVLASPAVAAGLKGVQAANAAIEEQMAANPDIADRAKERTALQDELMAAMADMRQGGREGMREAMKAMRDLRQKQQTVERDLAKAMAEDKKLKALEEKLEAATESFLEVYEKALNTHPAYREAEATRKMLERWQERLQNASRARRQAAWRQNRGRRDDKPQREDEDPPPQDEGKPAPEVF